ncbi:helix-turn-helix transcriptional regulator [Arabiibacter massiliensis]|uniref:helix-turn-helix transcriptional regulator n=1 Tax=Arabiibacter massiliensis TaxID=1870985 RepID=UPI0009B94FE0|nr:helix-turn-helix transcriptional regulator [Arabiibacter massiliensis]
MKTAGQQHSGDFKAFAATYLPGFSLSFLGTGVVLVWIQCILYARYIWVDSGLTTIAINFARCACIVVLGAIALRRAFSPRFERQLGWASATLMTLGSLLFFVQSLFPHLPFTLAAAVCSGVGLAWGGGMWMTFYIRLELREALLVAFSSLAFSTVIGIFIGYIEESTAFFISMLLPAVTLAMFVQAQKTLDVREARGIVAKPRDDVYADEPRSTLVRLIVGIALFSLVLGASRGFPFGESIKLTPLFQLVQHLGVTAAGLGVVWWTLVKGRGFKFAALWQAQLAALAVGVILLSTLDPLLGQVGAVLIAITNLFQVGFLWFVSYDVARHRALPSYIVLGFFWFLHLFFRESGRLIMWWLGDAGGAEQMLIIAAMICLLAVSVAFLLTDSIPRTRPLFAEVCGRCRVRMATPTQFSEPLPSAPVAAAVAPADAVREEFGLTNREAEVLALLAEGRSSSYIAESLVLSENTVRSYVKNIYQKLGVHSKQDLIDFMKGR